MPDPRSVSVYEMAPQSFYVDPGNGIEHGIDFQKHPAVFGAVQQFLAGKMNDESLKAEVRTLVSVRDVYDVHVVNVVVRYVGLVLAREYVAEKQQGASIVQFVSKARGTKLFGIICLAFDEEGRFYFLNALVDHLRFPNLHGG